VDCEDEDEDWEDAVVEERDEELTAGWLAPPDCETVPPWDDIPPADADEVLAPAGGRLAPEDRDPAARDDTDCIPPPELMASSRLETVPPDSMDELASIPSFAVSSSSLHAARSPNTTAQQPIQSIP